MLKLSANAKDKKEVIEMLIVEGIDGVGKTTLVEHLQQDYGVKKYHFDYDLNNMDLLSKYMKVLSSEINDKLVLDRSFISEMVYGPVIRNSCKLSLEDYTKLLNAYKKIGARIIYLICPKEILLKRRNFDKSDYEIITNYYEKLKNKYDEIMEYSSKFIDVITINTYEENIEQVRNHVKKAVIK